MSTEPSKTELIPLHISTRGFGASWMVTPETLNKFLEFAGECIVDAHKETLKPHHEAKPSTTPPARVGANDVKALPEPRVMFTTDLLEEVDAMNDTYLSVANRYKKEISVIVIPTVTKPPAAKIRAIQRLIIQDLDDPKFRERLNDAIYSIDGTSKADAVLKALGLLPTPTGRRKKGKK